MNPQIGDRYWDRDDRVSSRYVRVVDVTASYAVIRRGKDGEGQRSRVRLDNLRRRFIKLNDRGEFEA